MSYSTLYLGLGSVDYFQIYTAADHKYSAAGILDVFLRK